MSEENYCKKGKYMKFKLQPLRSDENSRTKMNQKQRDVQRNSDGLQWITSDDKCKIDGDEVSLNMR